MKNSQTLGLCWGSIPGGSLIDIARAAGENGLAAIAITAGHYFDAIEAGMTDAGLRSQLGAFGVRVSVIDPLMGPLPGIPPMADIAPAMQRFFTYTEAQCRRAAQETGAMTINLAHFLGKPTEMDRLRDVVAGIAERNHAAGHETTFEFIPGTGVPDLATAIDVCAASPHARVMFDTWHFARSDGTVEQLRALPSGAIGGMQLSDRVPPAPGEAYVPMSGRLCPGEGVLPLPQILAAIERNSPGLDVCMEVFSDPLKAMGWTAASLRMAETGRSVMADADRELAQHAA